MKMVVGGHELCMGRDQLRSQSHPLLRALLDWPLTVPLLDTRGRSTTQVRIKWDKSK